MSSCSFQAGPLVQGKLRELRNQDFPTFMTWMKEKWEDNPPALLSLNPPDTCFGDPDGSMNITLGTQNVATKRRQYERYAGTPFAYKMKTEGEFRTVLGSLSILCPNERLEAAMAFYTAWSQDNFLGIACEAKEIKVYLGMSNERLHSPLYRAVCEAVIEMFRESGWIKR
jgi:hypothetical protein